MPNLTKMYKVLLVEDEKWVRAGLKAKIEASGLGFQVSHEAMNGQAALLCLEQEVPDLLITDIRMPVMDGLELIRNVFFAWPGVKSMIISGYSDFQYAHQALKYEVGDYLLKPVATTELLEALTAIRIKLDATQEEILQSIPSSGQAVDQGEVARTVEQYIRENFRKDISLQDVSKKLRVSTDYLSKAFKRHTGESPLKHIIKLRINEAKKLLLATPVLDIHVIGEYVGYTDPFYFSRIFKTYVGIYPSEYRTNQAARAAIDPDGITS